MPQLDNVLAVLPEMIRAGGSQQALGLVTQVREEACGVLLMNAEAYPQAVLLSDHALELLALELRLAMRTGNDELVKQLVMVLEPIRGTIGLGPVESRELHEATASLLEAIARANRGAEAKVLVDWLTQVCLAKRLQSAGREPSPCLALTLRALLTTCLTLGNWEAGAKLAGFIREGSVRDPGLIAFAESINGMLLAATGDFESARGILFAAEQQLLVTGPPEEYEAVAGALAYCHAELHQNGNAVVTLTSGASHIGTDTPYGWVAEYFRALAMGKIHSHEAGRSRLRALERISSTKGEVLSQIHSVAALVRMGDHEAAVRLSSLCKNTEGSFPQAYARLADGVLEESGPLIVEALLLLIDLGFAAFALGEGNTIHELLSPAQRRQVARSVNLRRFASGSSREEAVEHFGEPKPFDLLTKRERFVASAAASGLSNLEIAEKASVSVRTVEGHLYQIYSKLTIRGRTELHNMAASLTGGSVESNA